MTPECTHTLPNGRKCRGLAGHNQPFCRHHRPQPKGQRPARREELGSSLARWRAIGRELPYFSPAELPSLIYHVLDTLTQPGEAHSDRTVGRFLREALSRLGHVPFPYPKDICDEPEPMTMAPAHSAPSPHPTLRNTRPGDLAQLQREMQTLFATLNEAQSQ